MEWLTWSLTAAILWAGVSVVDKVIIEKHIPHPCLYSFFFGCLWVDFGRSDCDHRANSDWVSHNYSAGLFEWGLVFYLYYSLLCGHESQ